MLDVPLYSYSFVAISIGEGFLWNSIFFRRTFLIQHANKIDSNKFIVFSLLLAFQGRWICSGRQYTFQATIYTQCITSIHITHYFCIVDCCGNKIFKKGEPKDKADVIFHASLRHSPHNFFVEEVGSRYIYGATIQNIFPYETIQLVI
jgi:hypothetical protein